MKILILGGGSIGFGAAEYIARQGGEVTIIEKNQQIAAEIKKIQNINVIVGDALNIETLKTAEADSFGFAIAAMSNDEQNIVVCKLLGSQFNLKTKIARINSDGILQSNIFEILLKENFDIDFSINPKIEIANAVCDVLQIHGAHDVIKTDHFIVVRLICLAETEVLNTEFIHFRSITDLYLYVLTITRDEKTFFPTRDDVLFPGDDIYIVTTEQNLNDVMKLFGYDQSEDKNILIIGGHDYDSILIKNVCKNNSQVSIVERYIEKAEHISEMFPDLTVMCGNPLDTHFMQDITHDVNTVIIFSAFDKTNVLTSLLLKQYNVNRIITILESKDYDILLPISSGYSVIDAGKTIIESMLQKSRVGKIKNVRTLKGQSWNIVEAVVTETCTQLGKTVKTLKIKNKLNPIFIFRNGITIFAQSEITLLQNDLVFMLVDIDYMNKVEEIFSSYIYKASAD